MLNEFPIRADIVALPEESPERLRIGFVCYESVGVPIKTTDEKLIRKDELKVGQKVIVYGLMDDYISVITSIDGETAKVQGLYAHLKYSEEHECWINEYFGNDEVNLVAL